MKKLNNNVIYTAVVALLLGLILGYLMFHRSSNEQEDQQTDAIEQTIWTCSMHPQIRKSEPGQCPICGMDLVKLNSEDTHGTDPLAINMSPTAMQLANVQTSIISKKRPYKEVRMNGKVEVDERRIFTQSSHIPGRIEKLMVSFTGEEVVKGQVLAYLYSPELIRAQEELLEVLKVKESQPLLFSAAKSKLLNLKLTETQINKILEAGEVQELYPILADVTGIVLSKEVNLGDYIRKGEKIFQLADLNKVWVLFDVYESDLLWVNTGNKVNFKLRSFPGEHFEGIISFVDPVIDPKTRVAKARVEVMNHGMKMKPDMFAIGLVKSPIRNMKEELVVPKSAVLWTGERSVVYVKEKKSNKVSFLMRIITLGTLLGDNYVVISGLKEGEEVVTNGAFSIDAAAQLAGKPSMMNQDLNMNDKEHVSDDPLAQDATSNKSYGSNDRIVEELEPSIYDYLAIKNALVEDDFKKSKKLSGSMLQHLNNVEMSVFREQAHDVWMLRSKRMISALQKIENAENIGQVRHQFKLLSDELILLTINFGPFDNVLYIQHCPMANTSKGADWISEDKKVANPYFGESMIGCGSVTKEIK